MEQVVSPLTAKVTPGAVRVAEVAVLYVSHDLIRARVKFHTKNPALLRQEVVDGVCSFVYGASPATKRVDKDKQGVPTQVSIAGVGNHWCIRHTEVGNYDAEVVFMLTEYSATALPQIIWTSGKGAEV